MNAGSNPIEAAAADSGLSYDAVAPAPLVFDGRRFSRQVAWTILVRGFMIVSSLAVGIIAGRWLGSAGFGTLAVLNLTIAYAVQIGNLGLVLANTYYVARDQRYLVPASFNAIIFSVLWGGIVSLVALWLVASAPGVFGDIQPKLMSIAVVSIPFQLITLFGLNLLLAMGLVERLNVLDALGQFLLVVSAVIALIILKSGLWMLVSFNIAASIVVSLLVVFSVVRIISKKKTVAER